MDARALRVPTHAVLLPRGRVCLLATLLTFWSFQAHAACGALPSDYAVYAGSKLEIKKGVSVNGNLASDGDTGAGSFLAPDGTRGTGPLSLPDLVPSSFPANPSSVKADEGDSPFVAASDAYFKEVKIAKKGSASFDGGGPFYIDKLEAKDGATLYLGAGVYFVDELKMGEGASLLVTGTDVILHIGDKMDLKKDVSINDGGGVTDLQVMLHDDAEFKGDAGLRFTGVIFGPAAKKVEIKKDSWVSGAIISAAEVKIGKDVQIALTPAEQSAIGGLTTCADSLSHFAISHSGSGVNCAAEPVAISAHLGDESLASSYTGTITLATDTGNGDWSLAGGNGTLINVGGGAASYIFDSLDGGVALLALRDTRVETVDIGVSDGSISESSGEDPALAFVAAGFRFLAGGVVSAIGTQIAGKSSAEDPAGQLIELEAIRTDTDTGGCESALTGVVQVQMAAECRDPGSCGVRQVGVNGRPVAGNGTGAVSSFSDVDLDFGGVADGTATLVLSYADAGRLRLHARLELLDEAGVATGDLMSGASNEYVVRPFAFEMDFSGDRATFGTGGVSYAADAAGTAFVAAGADFDTTLRAVLWEAADDTDTDGVADVGADLHDNGTTLRFGAESTPAVATVSHTLVAPAGGDAGALIGGASVAGFSGGSATVALRWDEVGIIDLAALAGDYLGGGAAVAGSVANVGRFHPARLDVADSGADFRDGPDSAWSCDFTYMEQPFAFDGDPVFTITAYNAVDGVTGNYGGDFFGLSAPWLAARAYASTATSSATLDAPALGTVTVAGHGNFDGIATLTLGGEQFAYNRGAAPEAPFAAAVSMTLDAADLTDDDGVCYSSAASRCLTGLGDGADAYVVADIGGASLRFGRLVMQNAAGSELLPIAMPLRSEFFDGSAFVLSATDVCSTLPLAVIDLVNDVADPLPGVAVIAVGGGSSIASIGNVPFVNGEAGLQFSAPLAGNTGHVQTTFDLDAAVMPWLRFDCDGDGAHDDDPVAR